MLSLVEIFFPVWVLQFQPMRGIGFVTGHMVYNPAYNQILQTEETISQENQTKNLNSHTTFFILKLNKELLLQKDQLRIQQKLFHKPILQKEYLELLVNLTTFLHQKNLLAQNTPSYSILKGWDLFMSLVRTHHIF